MSDANDFHAFNRGVIAEFRRSEGRVGGPFEGAPMVLITHRGAKTGTEYTTPLVYSRDGDAIVIIASKAGAPDDPQWFRNLVANPVRDPRLPVVYSHCLCSPAQTTPGVSSTMRTISSRVRSIGTRSVLTPTTARPARCQLS